MVYWVLLQKSYRRNLQYRLSHFINNGASAIFGLVFIAIWTGVLEGKESASPYSISTMSHYIALTQTLLWVTTFLTPGLGISNQVRTGAVSLDLLRPVSYFLYVLSQEAGKISYNFLYRSIPIAVVYFCTIGFYIPHRLETLLWATLSILFAIYIGLLLFYLVGISSFWTTEINGAHYILITLIFGLGGQLLPVDLLPGWLSQLAMLLPFSCLLYVPSMLYLEQQSPEWLFLPLSWAIILTIIALVVTQLARRRTEIQGG